MLFNNNGTVEWLPLKNLILMVSGFLLLSGNSWSLYIITSLLLFNQNTGGEFRIGGFIFREETSYDSLQLQRVAKTLCASLYRSHFLSSSRKHDFNIK